MKFSEKKTFQLERKFFKQEEKDKKSFKFWFHNLCDIN